MSTPDFIIRPMRLEDIEPVHALEVAIFPTPWSLNSYLFELQQNSASHQWVAEAQPGGQIAAYVVCWLLGGDELHIANIAVAPAHRRHGLGRRLLAHALAAGAALGAESAALEVRASNLAAQQLYAEFGFEVAAVRKGYYQDNHEDAWLMHLPSLGAFLAQQAGQNSA
ncbi:MAG: ribosomal protein S18-alanine N-acetyltransferase [Anaerolineales bacterium]|nr:MAG: ribosomal protein S18-alanine N-acetyltransferase [Anaerolineales bacterium]